MYIFLASNYRTRYLDEIVRSLALPPGSPIQLRYKNLWLSSKAKEFVQDEESGDKCLICYIKFTESGSEIVPVRFGTISSAKDEGSFAAIRIYVNKYAKCYDNDLFVKTIKQFGNKIPETTDSGYFFTDFDNSKSLDGVSSGINKEYWEETVKLLKESDDFQNRKYNFFRVDGFSERSKIRNIEKLTASEDGFFILKSGKSYTLNMAFSDTYSDNIKNNILVTSDDSIKFYTSTTVPIDTDYDVRQISFTTQVNSFSSYGHINIDSNQGESCGKDIFGIDFELFLKIKGSLIYNIIMGLVFGLFLFLANMKVSPSPSSGGQSTVQVFIENNWIRYLLSSLAGLVASFGIKKPFW